MPYPVSQEQTVTAVNNVLDTMVPKGHIDSLESEALSNKDWSCNFFGPTLLEEVCKVSGFKESDLVTTEYVAGAPLPASFDDNTFVNIAMLGEPSSLNHNFNILVSGAITYLIQTYVDNSVRIVQQFSHEVFMDNWKNISNNTNWAESYKLLFGVAPLDPSAEKWMQNQYVTL